MVVKHGLVTAFSEGDEGVLEEQIILDEIDERLVREMTVQVAGLDLLVPVDIVIAASLNKSVRSRATEIVGARYVGERPDERAAAARALRTTDGRHMIIVHAGLFSNNPMHQQSREAKGVSVPRIIQHESWHVLLMQNGEDPVSQARRVDPDGLELALSLAAHFLGEFRVERAMFEDEWERPEDAVGPLPVFETVGRLLRAQQTPADDSVEAFLETRLGRAHGAAQFVAHELARVVHLRTNAPDRVREVKTWLPSGGPFWDEIHGLVQAVPSAKVRITPTEFEPTLRDAWRIARGWMEHVGIDPALLGTPLHRPVKPSG